MDTKSNGKLRFLPICQEYPAVDRYEKMYEQTVRKGSLTRSLLGKPELCLVHKRKGLVSIELELTFMK